MVKFNATHWVHIAILLGKYKQCTLYYKYICAKHTHTAKGGQNRSVPAAVWNPLDCAQIYLNALK